MSHDLDQLVRSLRPEDPNRVTELFPPAIRDELYEHIVSPEPPIRAHGAEQPNRLHRHRFRRPTRAGILLAAVVAAGAVAAGAGAVSLFSAATGIQVNAGDRNARAIGIGQQIAMGAHDEVSVGVNLTRDIAFAPGYESWKARTIAFQTSLGPGPPPKGHAYISSSALRWQVAASAVCSWLNYYIASQAAGNTAAATSAAAQVRAAPSWPAITGYDRPIGLEPAVAAIGAGDAKLVQALIDTGQASANCGATGPFPPAGMSSADQYAKGVAAQQLGQREITTDPIARRLGIGATPSAAPPPSGG